MKPWILGCLCVLLAGCQPDDMRVEFYTSDLELVAEGEVIEVPATIAFSLLGDDEAGYLAKGSDLASDFLAPGTTFSQSKTMMGSRLVVETTLPLGTATALTRYFVDSPRVAALVVDADTAHAGTYQVTLTTTPELAALDRALSGMNLMLGAELPAKTLTVRVVSDSRAETDVMGMAVFVAEKPYLQYSKTLKRRDAVDLVFKGGSDSVYSEIDPQVWVQSNP